ncbi:hypothetical protein CYMTET_11273, partial [Cymbomonas tetramitiformis]
MGSRCNPVQPGGNAEMCARCSSATTALTQHLPAVRCTWSVFPSQNCLHMYVIIPLSTQALELVRITPQGPQLDLVRITPQGPQLDLVRITPQGPQLDLVRITPQSPQLDL